MLKSGELIKQEKTWVGARTQSRACARKDSASQKQIFREHCLGYSRNCFLQVVT